MIHLRLLLLCVVLTLSFTPKISAQPVVRDEVTATVQRTDGTEVTGVLNTVTFTLKELSLQDRPPIAVADVIRVEIAGTRTRFDPTTLVVLANGDRLVAELVSQDEAYLKAKWIAFPNRPELVIPLETVQSVALNLPGSDSERDRFLRRLLNSSPKNDVLLLKNGDQFTGEFAEANEKTIALTTQTATTKLPREATRAMMFNSELISLPNAPQQQMILTFSDGSRITAKSLQVKDGNCEITATTGWELSLPLTELRIAQPVGFGVQYLSELVAGGYRFTSFLGTSWTYRNDRNVQGGWLSLRGQQYARGIGMHSESVLEYALNGEYERFTATLGIDDSAGERGSVVFVVSVDNQEVYRSKVVTRSSQPIRLPKIDVKGKQKLGLSVLFGPFGDIQDHANWADALLIPVR